MIITKDIAKAIKKEEEYLYHKVELLDNTANIYEYLAEAGYDDINEFRNDAQEYYLHSQNMTLERVYITEESLNEWVTLSMSNTRLFRSSDIEDPSLDTVAIVGKDFNEHDKFIKEGVHPVVFNYMRGCIITGIEDEFWYTDIFIPWSDFSLPDNFSFETLEGKEWQFTCNRIDVTGMELAKEKSLKSGAKLKGTPKKINPGLQCLIEGTDYPSFHQSRFFAVGKFQKYDKLIKDNE